MEKARCHARLICSEKDLDYVQFGGRYLQEAYGDPVRTAVGSRHVPVLHA